MTKDELNKVQKLIDDAVSAIEQAATITQRATHETHWRETYGSARAQLIREKIFVNTRLIVLTMLRKETIK